MADAKETKQAEAIFASICEMLDGEEWKYEKDEENFRVRTGVKGDDLAIPLNFQVMPGRAAVSLYSPVPIDVPEERRVIVGVAVSLINDTTVHGNFDYDITEGNLGFRFTLNYRDSIIGNEALRYMLYVSCSTIDEYNDKLEQIASRDMDLDEVIALIKEKEDN